MRAVSTLTLIATALGFTAGSAHALGFGRITNTTQLGQPLNFAAAVRLDPDEQLPRECVSAEVMSGENKLQPGQIRVTLEGAPDSPERSVRVTTSTLIDEPVVTVSVTLGCGAKVTRKFVAFIDPPLISLPQSAAAETLPPQRNDSPVAPVVTVVQGERAEPPAARASQAAPTVRPRPRAATAVAAGPRSVDRRAAPVVRAAPPRASASAPRVVAAASPTASGPRLRLEALPDVVARSASSPASSPLIALPVPQIASAASPARSDETTEQLARERQRILALEQGLAQLRSDAQATQKSLVALQARIKEAESERYANPLVYALAWLSALLALAVAGLWWRQSRGRGAGQWWTAPSPVVTARTGATARPQSNDDAISAPQPLGAMPTAADAFAMSTVVDEDEPQVRAATSSSSPVSIFPATMPPHEAEKPRELSVEELIDLEQQAEFFIVLGQDDAAIELLMSHVRSDGGISPLPYMKLLEIYRRRGDTDAYERIRERFNRRFNAYAPDWESDLQQGRALADYPETLARLQGLWASPARVMESLDASLFRRNKSDETFDLPAYRELLFLYSISRDLTEHGGVAVTDTIDLLLPLGEPAAVPISRLAASVAPAEFRPSEMITLPLDLDVSFADAPAGAGIAPADPSGLDFDLTPPPDPGKGPSGTR